jgi:hypothetical protein
MTAIDSARFTASAVFQQACSLRGLEDVASDAVAQAEEQKIAPHTVAV